MTAKTCLTCKVEKNIEGFELRADTKRYRNQCKACRLTYVNKYRRTNDEYKVRYNQYRKKRRDTDLNYYYRETMRVRIRDALKNNKDTSKSIELLGCSIKQFKEYLTERFYGDMSWEKRNFELDHIIPCVSFDLSDPEQLALCFHYTNYQPLFHDDNVKKSDKIF